MGQRQMVYIPWSVRNFISEHFPLFYHLAANVGVKSNSPEHWDARLAETWDAAIGHWPTKNERIASLTQPSEVIIDIGCGNGSILRYLKSHGYLHLHGLEVSDYAIKRLRGEDIEMDFGKPPSMPLPDASYDVVIASQVLDTSSVGAGFCRKIGRALLNRAAGHLFSFRTTVWDRSPSPSTSLSSLRVRCGNCSKSIFLSSRWRACKTRITPCPSLFALCLQAWHLMTTLLVYFRKSL